MSANPKKLLSAAFMESMRAAANSSGARPTFNGHEVIKLLDHIGEITVERDEWRAEALDARPGGGSPM